MKDFRVVVDFSETWLLFVMELLCYLRLGLGENEFFVFRVLPIYCISGTISVYF